MPLEASPGTRAEYSDIGFILLGKALEVLAREPLDVFCAREIFAPLALTATRYQPPPVLARSDSSHRRRSDLSRTDHSGRSPRRELLRPRRSQRPCRTLFQRSRRASFRLMHFAGWKDLPTGQTDSVHPPPSSSLRLVKIRRPTARVPWDGTLPPANRHLGVILASARSDISAIPAPRSGSTSNDRLAIALAHQSHLAGPLDAGDSHRPPASSTTPLSSL